MEIYLQCEECGKKFTYSDSEGKRVCTECGSLEVKELDYEK